MMEAVAEGQSDQRIIGRYVLHAEIAHGGMATVHFGRLVGEVGFSRTVAIKCLHAQYAKDPEFKSMFLDEARLCARVRHPNVVPIIDVVALEGELFMVMEYVQGETLSRLIRTVRATSKRIPLRVVAAIMTNALEGLHAAHEAVSEQGEPLGIVHRDVSPQNIIVGVDGVARVLDFGVAKAAGRLQTTRDGQLKGKLPYMAPEQLRGTRIDRRTDVYAAAVVLWEALTGRRLFDAEDEVVIFGKVLEGAFDAPSAVVPSLPRSLDDVCLRGLQRDPEKRFQTAQEMAIALERAVGVAIPREVGRWVEQNAASSLKKRMERIAEIESVSSINVQNFAAAPRSLPVPTPPPAPVSQAIPPSQQYAPPPPSLGNYTPPGVGPSPPSGLYTAPAASVQTMPSMDLQSSSNQFSQAQFTALSMAQNYPQSQARRNRSVAVVVSAIIAFLLVLGAAIAVLLVLRRPPAESPLGSGATTPTQTASQPVPTAPSVAASTVETAPPVTTTPATASVVASAAPTQTTRPPVTGPGKKQGASGGPTSTAATTAPTPPKPDCNPPYTLDANGVRIPKPQCI